jgi:hypothetical protein
MTPTTLTTELIAELRRLMAEATPGPWRFRASFRDCVVHPANDGRTIAQATACFDNDRANAALIAAAVNALPALLDAVEREAKMRAYVTQALLELTPESHVEPVNEAHVGVANRLLRAALAQGGAQ